MSKASESLANLLERAENVFAGEGMTQEDPLSLEVNGKYVDILFSTGGPHVEVQFEFDDAEAGEYWFENEARCGRLTYMDWGTREDIAVSGEEAWLIQSAIMRDPDDLVPRLDTVTIHVFGRAEGTAHVEVELGGDIDATSLIVDDGEPDDVWGLILQRAVDEAIGEYNADRDGLHTLPDFTVTGWKDVKQDLFLAVFEVSVEEFTGNES